jgi:hypothetical protein
MVKVLPEPVTPRRTCSFSRRQGGDGLRLVAGGLVFGYDLKLWHEDLLPVGFQ